MDKVERKIGLGTISLLLSIIGIILAFSFGEKGALGDVILKSIGIQPWSNGSSGIDYTIFYSLIFFVPSVVLDTSLKII